MIEVILIDSTKQTMSITGELASLTMIPLLIVGLSIAVFQAATQINEASLSFIPKLVVIFFIVLVGGDALLDTLTEFTRHILSQIPVIVR